MSSPRTLEIAPLALGLRTVDLKIMRCYLALTSRSLRLLLYLYAVYCTLLCSQASRPQSHSRERAQSLMTDEVGGISGFS